MVRRYIIVLGVGAVCFGICALFVVPRIGDGKSAAAAVTKTRAATVVAAMEHYRDVYGSYPATEAAQLLSVLAGRDIRHHNSQQRAFLEIREGMCDRKGRLLDGWHRPFVIVYSNGTQFLVIHSWGKNGQDDGGRYDDTLLVKALRVEP